MGGILRGVRTVEVRRVDGFVADLLQSGRRFIKTILCLFLCHRE